MRRTRNGFTRKQYAYAKRVLGGEGQSKKEIALASGYAPSVAYSVMNKIEKTEGFDNAMSALASESGNIMLKVFHEIKHKDISGYELERLLNAVTIMSQAWQVFTPKQGKDTDNGASKLRSIVLNRIENQTIQAPTVAPTDTIPEPDF